MARSKKEIDKELMYKKLMPTAQANADAEDAAAAQQVQSLATPASPSPPAAPIATVPLAPPPAAPVASAPGAPLANVPLDIGEPSQASAAAAIVSGQPPCVEDEIVNVMELLVNARIDAAMDKFRCCTCDICHKDVTAITLNKLAPCYILSSDSAKRLEIETKFAGQVATALVQAILTVKARPTHE